VRLDENRELGEDCAGEDVEKSVDPEFVTCSFEICKYSQIF